MKENYKAQIRTTKDDILKFTEVSGKHMLVDILISFFVTFSRLLHHYLDQLTNDELSASSCDEFASASKIHKAPHSLMKAKCEPEQDEDEEEDMEVDMEMDDEVDMDKDEQEENRSQGARW